MQRGLLLWMALSVLFMGGCQFPAGTTPAPMPEPTNTLAIPTSTIHPALASETPEPTETIAPVPAPSETSQPAGACEISVPAGVNIYTRPSIEADLFYTTGEGELMPPALARTNDGWIGFDPGIAQAANVGPFRLRWLQESQVTLTGGCSGLPVIQGPPPGVCFNMFMVPSEVHSGPDYSTSVVITLDYGDYAELLGTTPDQSWAKISMLRGSPSMDLQGWIDIASLNVNGPCTPLPTVQP